MVYAGNRKLLYKLHPSANCKILFWHTKFCAQLRFKNTMQFTIIELYINIRTTKEVNLFAKYFIRK
jgi:hypothetical protein